MTDGARSPSFKDFVDKAFWAMALGIASLAVYEIRETRVVAADTAKSIQELNIKMAVIVERVAVHDSQIQDLRETILILRKR
ncbi:MAG: hypothetical protein ACRCXD_09840 [Luteolibacter sp.]